ncbi:hypothetical protein D5R40_33780 [Okeania hirsuta]|uniref:Uncharacterized protein n=2 Tax=Okeania hirsuta TaxID=1458930 RepID=A0A3N6NWM4_9CYAN|nr:hypothetical protein D5R40_33780 [Okeania hirsuta]
MSSDHYRLQSLNRLIKVSDLDEADYNHLLKAGSSMNSDHYLKDFILQLSRVKQPSENLLVKMLKLSGENINSDNYLTDVLVNLARNVNSSGSTAKAAYKEAAKNIGSEHYYGRAMKALND